MYYGANMFDKDKINALLRGEEKSSKSASVQKTKKKERNHKDTQQTAKSRSRSSSPIKSTKAQGLQSTKRAVAADAAIGIDRWVNEVEQLKVTLARVQKDNEQLNLSIEQERRKRVQEKRNLLL